MPSPARSCAGPPPITSGWERSGKPMAQEDEDFIPAQLGLLTERQQQAELLLGERPAPWHLPNVYHGLAGHLGITPEAAAMLMATHQAGDAINARPLEG